MKNFFKKLKRFWLNLKNGYRQLFLNISDYLQWVFTFKKKKNEVEEECLNLEKKIIYLQNRIANSSLDNISSYLEKEKLIKKYDDRIHNLNKKVSNQKKELKELSDKYKILLNDFDEKEICYKSLRGKYARSIREINSLKEELDLLNKKLEFSMKNRKSPSSEEIKAYELSYREVLKRQKERKNDSK